MSDPRLPSLLIRGLSLAVVGLVAAFALGRLDVDGQPPPAPERIRGITLDARHPPAEGMLARLAQLGVTHLTVIPYAFQPTATAPEIRHRPDGNWYAESDDGIRSLAEQTRALGMKLVLKPQLWLQGGAWTADIRFETEAEWQAWEASYRKVAMHYAYLAAEVDAALLVIATELGTPVRERPDFWRGLIAEIRAVYDGPLTYAANWYDDDYEAVTFWDALDYVGVQAYFPLTASPAPSLDTLKAAWAPHGEALRRIHERTGRPVLLTEIGYRSVPYAAAEPWRWPSRDEYGHLAPDYALQARLYQAFFETCWDAPWMAGAIIWKWQADGERQERNTLRFTPQDKPAEAVLQTWFTKDTEP